MLFYGLKEDVAAWPVEAVWIPPGQARWWRGLENNRPDSQSVLWAPGDPAFILVYDIEVFALNNIDKLISHTEGFEDDFSWKKCSQIFLLTELEIEMGIIDSLFNL